MSNNNDPAPAPAPADVLDNHHDVNDGSGTRCLKHSYSNIDHDTKAETRIKTLSTLLRDKQYGGLLDQDDERLISAICALGEATAHIAVLLSNYVEHHNAYAGTQNASGDEQLHLDIDCDNAVFAAIRASGVYAMAASEETPRETNVRPTVADADADGAASDDNKQQQWFTLGFDPLDGSSIIDANFAVGSIFGIWPGIGVLHRSGREQVAAAVALYGPRTTLAIALPATSNNNNEARLFEVTLVQDRTVWELSRDRITIDATGKVFAPGNLRASNDNDQYQALIKHWIGERYTLRYSGGLVPDVYHIFCKSKGVFANVSSEKAKAKLRLLYEVAPLGLCVECAGGVTTHESSDQSVLDIPIDDLDQRLGVCMGSAAEVAKYKEFMF